MDEIREMWDNLSNDDKVNCLVEFYNDLTCAQKDKFLMETGNQLRKEKTIMKKTKRETYIGALKRATIGRGGKYDLSDKELIFFVDDTKKQKGESFNVLSLNIDGDLNLSIEVDYYGSETWEIEDLTDYEVELIFNAIQD